MKNKKLLIIVGSIIALIAATVIVLLINNNKKTTYEISFRTDGGSLIESQTISKGEKVKKPVDPTKNGYMFIEWTYQGKAYDFSNIVESDLVLTAKWVKLKDKVETFVVKFETDGGTTISNQIVEKGNKVSKPIDPIKDGYTFKGWTLNNELYDFQTTIEKDIELKAKWEKIEEINNNITNNSGSNNNNITNNNNDSNTTNPTPPTTPTTPSTPEPVKKYTVTFNSNGGSNVESQIIEHGKTATKPTAPTKEGYTFKGWYLNEVDYNFNKKVTKDITLTAKWEKNEVKPAQKYTVTFNSNGGSSVASQTIEEGNKATEPTTPTKEGYNFGGWLLNNNSYNFNSPINGNITLVAKWNQKNYNVVANKVDNISPARVLTVYEEGNIITVKTIQYNDGTTLCSGENPKTNYYVIEGETNLKLVLMNGTVVTASLTIN